MNPELGGSGVLSWVEGWGSLFAEAQEALFEQIVQPVLFQLGGASYLSEAYDGTGWFLVGLLQIAFLLAVIGPLQRLWPAEAPPTSEVGRLERRSDVRADVVYTFIHRLGFVRVALFFAVDPLWNWAFGRLAVAGFDGWHLDQMAAAAWPALFDSALAGFLVYLLVFDLANYAIHRAQHRWNWWWALHAVHHSQRHMTGWTDSRNHLLDNLLVDASFVILARLIGVAPGQFVGLVACSQLVENFSHANLRWNFGWLGERLLVGPRFHRIHHAVGLGHESRGVGSLGGHNFAVLLPVWDLIFRSARFDAGWPATGIRDQAPEHGGRDYGRGFWAQQRLGLLRLIGRA
jgi:sterol desaturase/sphingolipid hydroxylase (fatty acid hydroxylase superfamily)